MAIADLAKPEVAQLISQPLTACMATINADGMPHQTYVWYAWDGRSFLVSTTKDRAKYRNLVRNPQGSISILDPGNPFRFVSVSGTVDISEEHAHDFLAETAVRYTGEQRGRAYAVSQANTPRVILRLTPQHVIINGF